MFYDNHLALDRCIDRTRLLDPRDILETEQDPYPESRSKKWME
jgi:hypothetical protein